MASRPKVKVSERALMQRINRKLVNEGEKLLTSRSTQMEQECGRFYVIDLQRNFISSMHIDLEQYGREIEVLKEWEVLETAK